MSGESSTRGAPSTTSGQLASRVQSLRIPPAAARQNSRFPWLIAAAMSAVAVYFSLGGTLPGLPQPFATRTDDSQLAGETAPSDQPGNKASAGAGGNKPNPTTGAAPTAAPKSESVAGTIVLESKGYIIPEQQILVSPQVSGRIVELNFDAGQQVQQGDVLAILDDTEYQADHARAMAQVAAARERQAEAQRGSRPDEIRQAQAELAEATTQLQQAQRMTQRRKELFAQKIVPSQDLEDAQSEQAAIEQRVARLTAMLQLIVDGPREERKQIAAAELKAAEAELIRSQWRLDNTIIKAPIGGTILKKNAELGNLVNPIAFNGSFSLCDIADLTKLEVELDIQERDISKVKVHQKCRLRSEAYPNRFYDGYVSRLMPIANRAKGAVPVRVRIAVPPDEQGQYLKPEMGATVTFFAETVSPETLPAGAPVPPTNSARPVSATSPELPR